MTDLEAKQKKIDELEAENAYLRQEIRGLKKQVKKLSPLFNLSFAPAGHAMNVAVRNEEGQYWNFLNMNIEDEQCSNEVFEVYTEIIDVFRKHGYE